MHDRAITALAGNSVNKAPNKSLFSSYKQPDVSVDSVKRV